MYWIRTPKRADLEGGTVMSEGDGFDKSFAVWMATMRRRDGADAVVESLQRIFPALADDKSLEQRLGGIAERARDLGYEKVWLVPALAQEPLFAPALKVVSEALGRPVVFVPTSGMAAMQVG